MVWYRSPVLANPDEQFVAYTQVGGTGSEICVMPYPPTGRRWLVSDGSGEEPIWRTDHNEIVFRQDGVPGAGRRKPGAVGNDRRRS